MEFEQRGAVQESPRELNEAEGKKPAEIVIGPRHLLTGIVLFAALVFAAGLGWWTLSNKLRASDIIAALRTELAAGQPAADPKVAQPAPPVVTPTRQPATRRMVLPPVRKGFKPQPEAFAVKGDPSAPVTIVEFSDYQ